MKTTFAHKYFLLIAAGALSFAPTVLADVHLPNLFSDGAVLQRGMDAPIWGTADAGETITVSLNGKQAKTTADNYGRWMLKLPALKAGGPFDLTVSGKIPSWFIMLRWVRSGLPPANPTWNTRWKLSRPRTRFTGPRRRRKS